MFDQLCKHYLSALEQGSLEQVLSLFETDAVVDSPLYGEVPVERFYTGLFNDTRSSDTRLINIFRPENDDQGAAALHFAYTWTLSNGKRVEFECVDVFELSAQGKRFSRLKIIYDTAPVRPDFDQNRNP